MFRREDKEEWIKSKYVDKIYFCREICLEKIITLDEHILKALRKVPEHHVNEVKRNKKKIGGRRRPNIPLFKRFSTKPDKKNTDVSKRNSTTATPEYSLEIQRNSSHLISSASNVSRYTTYIRNMPLKRT